MTLYTILKDGEFIESPIPGLYAGWNGGRKDRLIFGRLTCESGERLIKRENRVFFHSLEDAVSQGYRPCKKCRPIGEEEFLRIQNLVPMYTTLEEFYNRDI